MITKKVVVTNNPKALKKYDGSVDVLFMENGSADNVLRKVKELLMEGARLSNPEIKAPTCGFRTVGLFYGDANAPLERNIKVIEAAIDLYANSKKSIVKQYLDLWRCKMSTKAVEGGICNEMMSNATINKKADGNAEKYDPQSKPAA